MNSMAHLQYDHAFYAYTDEAALRSAQVVASEVHQILSPESIADFGCGCAGWVAVWKRLGVADAVGVDGSWVDSERLLIEPHEFVEHDLCRPIDLGRRFDLVQSLEVAEHLPATAAEGFVKTLTSHSDVVLFSAAPPGDGGMQHINEQPYDYWRELFRSEGFLMFDVVRPRLRDRTEVEPWYRYNAFIYVREERVPELPEEIQSTRVDKSGRVADVAPWSYRVRRALIRPLPVSVVSWLSWVKMRSRSLARKTPGGTAMDGV